MASAYVFEPFFKCDTKKEGLSVVSEFVVGVWDGLDEFEISLPEILSQSCSTWCLFSHDTFIS